MFGRRSADAAAAPPAGRHSPFPMAGSGVSTSSNLVWDLRADVLGTGPRFRHGCASIAAHALDALPRVMEEDELPCRAWATYDKAFACAWLDGRRAAVGTKCNRLLLVDTLARTASPVPLPPPPQPRPARPPGADPPGAGVFGVAGPAGAGMHAVALSPGGGALASGGADASDVQVFRFRRLRGGGGGGGAHHPGTAAAAAPRRGPPPPPLTPTATLVGHGDWVFGLAWLTDRHLVSASRDRTLALWALPDGHDDDGDDGGGGGGGGGGHGGMEVDGGGGGASDDENENGGPRAFSSPPATPRRLVRAGSDDGGSTFSRPPGARRAHRRPRSACEGAAACVASRAEKRDRVRDVRFDPATATLASLTTGGVVRLWDPHLDPLGAVRLAHDREAVCLAVGGGGAGGGGAPFSSALVAAGSQAHISLIDPRMVGIGCTEPPPVVGLAFGGTRLGNAAGVPPASQEAGGAPAAAAIPPAPAGPPGAGVVAALDSPDGPTGVRSLALAGHVLSAGTGAGRLSFFDLRAGRWACLGHAPPKPPPRGDAAAAPAGPAPPPPPSPPRLQFALTPPPLPAPPPRPRTGLAAGPGWVEPNAVFVEHFSGPGAPPVPPAIYAHAWAPGGRAGLLAVGGPLATGLRGMYMGHWR